MRHRPEAFPIGLYGMLLFALCWLILPAVFAPLERLLLGGVCLVPRQVATWLGQPALAAESPERARLSQLTADLTERMYGADTALPAGLGTPVHTAVLAVGPRLPRMPGTVRRGGGGGPCELTLDHSYAELADCHPWVTKGDSLLGVLLRPGQGLAAAEGPDDPARVLLLNHPAAPPQLAGIGTVGGELAVVLQPAATVDPAPLRVQLWNDPYRGARLDQSGLAVRTRALPAAGAPPDLLLGTTRIWGYPRGPAGEALTLGVFVVPVFQARALSHVVVWRHGNGGAAARAASSGRWRELRRRPAVVHDLPGASYGRHLVVFDGDLPAAAAVVADGLFLGTAQGLAFGTGLLTGFVASRQRWSLLLLPADPGLPPQELSAVVVATAGSVAWLSADGVAGPLVSGFLFTGSNGPHCPAGLWIGRAEPDAEHPTRLRVETPHDPGPRMCEVVVGGGP